MTLIRLRLRESKMINTDNCMTFIEVLAIKE